jgi:simple sugar transport system ATP-binding protein
LRPAFAATGRKMQESLNAPAHERIPNAAEALHVSKSFGANLVLRDVSITIPRGDARALVGRNGAGKSTLVGVLTGLLIPEAGTIAFAGEVAPPIRTGGAWRRKVACVYQKSTLVPTLSVAENLFINAQPDGSPWIDWKRLRREAQAVADEWELGLDVDTEAWRLRVEQRQIVEIARALVQGARFIILDEPTAALENREIERLFERIIRLRSDGVTLLYISHHLQEIYDICESVTVMRDGRIVAESPLATMPKHAVVNAMVGEELATGAGRRPPAASAPSVPALAIEALTLDGVFEDVTLRVGAGECLGLAGLSGSGKEEIGDVIAGLMRPTRGAVRVGGTPLRFGDVAHAQAEGVSYVPRDRRRRGILPQLSVAENLTITIPSRLGEAGFIRPRLRTRLAEKMSRSLSVVASSTEQPVMELSGGNQQKVVMGRALASDPKVLVLVYPTQGVDVQSKEALFDIVAQAQAAGAGVLLISDEPDELRVCHRVAIIFKGRLVKEFGADWTEQDLIASMEGVG